MKKNINDSKISKDLKYIALYTKLGFFEYEIKNIYKCKLNNYDLKINLETNNFFINEKLIFNLNNHNAFVLLELIINLMKCGINYEPLNIDIQNYSCCFMGFKIICQDWDNYDDSINTYTSRLYSGLIERKCNLNQKITTFLIQNNLIYKSDFNLDNDTYLIVNGVLEKIKQINDCLIIPPGTIALKSSLLWDNHQIKKIQLPDTLISMGGDTFYNCINLENINIPKNVQIIGNNPFAGCLKLEIDNQSKNFIYENFMLFNKHKTELIYANIKNLANDIIIPDQTLVLAKHCFYKCNNLVNITLNSKLLKMENNPFSGCENIKQIINNSDNFYIYKQKIIYNRFKEVIISVINNINADELHLLETTKVISRNSFWNCKNIKKLFIPSSVENIGYNPFVGCKNIEFYVKKNNKYFVCKNGVLYTKNYSKLICYPYHKAVGDIILDERVITLERGAFSGAELMKSINLKNVNHISKTCFSNCNQLINIYVSDLVGYIGEWAFSNCKNLKEISVYKDTYLDINLINNSLNAKIITRFTRDNYVFESDNIYTLKSMLKQYANLIDSILIDPPYNSNVDYIEYKDDYGDAYIDFMQKRISISYKLLSLKGFLCINIDENNLFTILEICKSVFLYENIFVHKWEKIHPYFDINKQLRVKNKKQVIYEYIIICKKDINASFNLIKQPYFDETNNLVESNAQVPEIFSLFGTNSSAKDEIEQDFGDRLYFSTPKPIKLIKELIRATTNKDSIILDYFCGSGTTGIACLELNYELNQNRNFILITNSEENICKKVTIPRIKKYCQKYNNKFIEM